LSIARFPLLRATIKPCECTQKITDSDHLRAFQSKHRNIMELIKNNRLSLQIAQTMRDLTKAN
jgi:hypothetical protein